MKYPNQIKQEIENIVFSITEYTFYETKLKKEISIENPYQVIDKQLKKVETYYDKLYEIYQRCLLIVNESI